MASQTLRVSKAICRQVPCSLENGITSKGHASIAFHKAVEQHQMYVDALTKAIGRGEESIFICDADENHPDCVFVEDTAVITGPTSAVSTTIGALSRRGEEPVVKAAVLECGINDIIEMKDFADATLDGGDVLFTGRHVFVGLSSRTNKAGVDVLRRSFPLDIPVFAIPVIDNLHLKCAVTAVNDRHLIVAGTNEGRSILRQIFNMFDSDHGYTPFFVENAAAANVVRCNSTLIVPEGVSAESSRVYETVVKLSQQELGFQNPISDIVSVNNSEFTKLDGSLTCRSVLLWA